MERSKRYGYNIGDRLYNYFIVDKFVETDFKKSSKKSIIKRKFFNLSKILQMKQLPSVEIIANFLNNKKWEELYRRKNGIKF